MKSKIAIVLISSVSLVLVVRDARAQHTYHGQQMGYAPAMTSPPPGHRPWGAYQPAQPTYPAPQGYAVLAQYASEVVPQAPTSAMAPQPVPMSTEAPLPTGSGCSGSDSCSSCWSCDGCGDPSCACDCGPFGFALGNLKCQLHNSRLGGLLHGAYTGGPRPALVWLDAELLYWWNRDRTLPILATTSPDATDFDEAGVLGEPGTSVLFGGNEFDRDPETGLRGSFGVWLNSHQTLGVGGRGFFLGPEDITYSAQSPGSPILARPFFNIDLGIEDSLVIAYPGTSSGRIDIRSSNELQGYELFLRKMLYYGHGNRVDIIGGYHGTRINDSVRISDVIISEQPNGRIPFGTTIETEDIFRARNEFHGGEVGLMATGFDGRLTWNLLSKVSFGNTREEVTIQGQTTTTIPGGGAATSNFGLLTLPTNIGVYEADEFTIVPELALNVAYSVTSWLQASVGYSVIYWTNAALATDAIDTTINPSQIGGPLVGPARPTYSLNDVSTWAQGLTFGINGRF